MKISVFNEQDKNELSMIEVAHALLEQKNEEMYFNDLVNAIQEYLGKTDTEIKDTLSRFYTDLNIDGSFISLGENRWGLRSWYAIDEIDEEITSLEEDEEDSEVVSKRKKRNGKVNAFINSPDDDVIDYNDDDPEDDAEFNDTEDDIADKSIDDDDDDEEIVAYDSDLKEIVVDEEDEDVEIDEVDEDLDEDIDEEIDDEFEELNTEDDFIEDYDEDN